MQFRKKTQALQNFLSLRAMSAEVLKEIFVYQYLQPQIVKVEITLKIQREWTNINHKVIPDTRVSE